MKNLVDFYTEENLRLEEELKKIKARLANLSILRLLVFFQIEKLFKVILKFIGKPCFSLNSEKANG